MFTGIIERQGKVLNLESQGDSLKILVASGYSDLELGESVAVNGVCLTVAELPSSSSGDASFFISSESLQRTNLGSLKLGSLLNLERALTLQTRLSGHLVQGHVDGKAKLLEIVPGSESYPMSFELPEELSRYCVEKGSITMNGVSLTINSATETVGNRVRVDVRLIPHTWSHTNLSQLAPGDFVNIEVDILAKYVERLCRR